MPPATPPDIEKLAISKISIKGFKSIRNLENFKLGDLTVLIGANGAGKSNFISFFRMLSEIWDERLQVWTRNQGKADRVLTFGLKGTSSLSASIETESIRYQYTLEPTVDGGFTFAYEAIFPKRGDSQVQLPLITESGHSESRLKDKWLLRFGYEPINAFVRAMNSWRVYHFHDTSGTSGVKRYSPLQESRFLKPDGSNLPAFLYRIWREDPGAYQQIRKTVALALPLFDDFVLEPETLPTEEKLINLQWRQKDSEYRLWPSQLSDGSIRFICLATVLLQPEPPSTIIIDEPELGLHPHAINLLGALIRAASQRVQVIISTQSVTLLNEFSLDQIVVVDRVDGVSEFKRLNEEDFKLWLDEYTIGELWEKNVLGGRPTG